jgi:hypothetical protein
VLAVLVTLPMSASCSASSGPGSAPTAATVPTPVSAAGVTTAAAPASGLHFELPAGWQERQPQSELPAGVRVERLVAGATIGGFTSNITVVSQALPAGAALGDAIDTTLAAARSQGHTIIGGPESAGAFDGVEGVRYAWSMPSQRGGQIVQQNQVALVRGDRAYFVTLSGDRTDPDLGTAMDVVQASWRWGPDR